MGWGKNGHLRPRGSLYVICIAKLLAVACRTAETYLVRSSGKTETNCNLQNPSVKSTTITTTTTLPCLVPPTDALLYDFTIPAIAFRPCQPRAC